MDIFGDIIVAILEIITPHNTYDSDYNMVQIGLTLVIAYFLMMFTAIGMGIWVLTVNVPDAAAGSTYFRIRTYKTAGGKTYYSKWSAVKVG